MFVFFNNTPTAYRLITLLHMLYIVYRFILATISFILYCLSALVII